MKVVLLALVLLSACAQPVTAPSSSPEISGTMSGAPDASEEVVAVSPAVPTVVAKRGAPKPTAGTDTGYYCSDPPNCGYVEEQPPKLSTKSEGGSSVHGTATYYCRPGISRCTKGYPDGMYAAAGPELRALLGPDWRGSEVIVTDALGNVAVVRIIDVCACGGDHVIDLYWLAFQGIVNPVEVREP